MVWLKAFGISSVFVLGFYIGMRAATFGGAAIIDFQARKIASLSESYYLKEMTCRLAESNDLPKYAKSSKIGAKGN